MKTLAACVLPLALVVLAACQADPRQAPPALKTDPLNPAAIPQQIAIEGIDNALVSGTPIVTPSGPQLPLRVTVPLRSIVDRPLNIQYRFEFFDAAGRSLRSNGGWVFTHLEPRTTAQVEGQALESTAASWNLVVRPAH